MTTPGIGWTPETDRDHYAYLDIPARWTDEFPIGTRKPARPTHRGLAIRAERRTLRQSLRAHLPRFSFRR